ncbi:hypothetical protein BH20CHL4_BH20CHL4_10630 [soil metagenome]
MFWDQGLQIVNELMGCSLHAAIKINQAAMDSNRRLSTWAFFSRLKPGANRYKVSPGLISTHGQNGKKNPGGIL